jgi:hypothetical protein
MIYANSKLYSIRSHQTNKLYIGCTTQTLAQRLAKHKTGYRLWLADNSKGYLTSYEILQYDDAYIELIEEYPCENKNQLRRREGELIRAHDCVNKNIAGRTKAEYRQDNAEYYKQQGKQYYQDNIETIKQRKKQYYQDNAESIKQREKQYYQDNIETIKQHQKQYRQNNAERIKQYQKQYRQNNAERIKQYQKQKNTV